MVGTLNLILSTGGHHPFRPLMLSTYLVGQVMRTPEYLSPTSLALYEENPETFYMRYLCDERLKRDPQTQPMSIGSSLDAYVKSALHEAIFGKGADPRFEFQTIFESQVEPHNRDWALDHGLYCFEFYKNSGAYFDLLADLLKASNSPRFEFEIKGIVSTKLGDEDTSLILSGKPDVFYVNKDGHPIILDFKVNGWCSKSAVSPKPGYLRLRDGSGTNAGSHKAATIKTRGGVSYSAGHPLETVDKAWARQLAIYGWLLGEEVGNEFFTFIDQFVCKPVGEKYPVVRVAEHRTFVSEAFQRQVYEDAKLLWQAIKTGHIFLDRSRTASDQLCRTLDAKVEGLNKLEADPDFDALCRPAYYG